MSVFDTPPGPARAPWPAPAWPPARPPRTRATRPAEHTAPLLPAAPPTRKPSPLPPSPAQTAVIPASVIDGSPVGGNPVTVTVQFTVYGEDAFATAAAVADRLRPIVRAADPIRLDRVAADPLSGVPVLGAPVLEAVAPVARSVPEVYAEAPLRILSAGYRAELDGVPLALTRREYDLLLFLADHPGQVFTRVQLLQTVWQQAFVSGQRTIDVHVRRLRAKLGDRGPRIATVRGVGYRLDAPDRVSIVRDA